MLTTIKIKELSPTKIFVKKKLLHKNISKKTHAAITIQCE
jgi:hypothetical protein